MKKYLQTFIFCKDKVCEADKCLESYETTVKAFEDFLENNNLNDLWDKWVKEQNEKLVESADKDIEQLKAENEKLKALLIEAAKKTHKSKELYDWYCLEGEK